ncbi:MAG: CBS domain-containing protein [Planktomarina sp.]
MLVSNILKSKQVNDIVTVGPDTTVADAAKMLSSKKIGTVVVSPDGRHAAGILSERDIVREIGQNGSACLSATVDTIMTSKLVTCTSKTTNEDVLQQMTDGRFRHMPVVDDGILIGLISLGDVVKAQLTELAREKEALTGMIMGH